MASLDRKIKPIESGSINFSLPKIHHDELNNGLKVFFVHKDKLPITKLNLIISAGSRYDAYGLEGISYLTALLADEGTKGYNALEFDDEIDKLGSAIDISTNTDNVFISLLSLEENFERSLELYSKILTEPRFDEESFEREKKKHLTKIIQSFDDASYIAANAFQKMIFKNTFYEFPTLGNTKSVTALTNKDVIDFNHKFYNSSDAKLVVVSNIPKDKIFAMLNKYLAGWQIKNKIGNQHIPVVNKKAKIYFIHKDGAAQTEIAAGHLIPKRSKIDYYSAVLANSILGGQFSSRINLNLREDKGYTYGASSSFSFNKEIGYFSLSTSVQSEATLQSIKEIDKEINGLRDFISEEELAFTKSYLIKRFPSLFETYSQVAQHLSSKIVFNLPDDYFDKYIESISDISLGQVKEAAVKYLQPENMLYFLVGNKELIWDELKNNDLFEVVEMDKFGNLI